MANYPNKRFFSIRVVKAKSQEEAIQKVQDGDFDDNHNLSDAIINGDDVNNLTKFPNGFIAWIETYHVIAEHITLMLNKSEDEWSSKVQKSQSEEGMGGIWTLCRDLTDKFEQENTGVQWDGNWIDAIDDFLQKELA